MKKLKAFVILLLCFLAMVFVLPQEHVFASDITTTTTAEEITTTTSTQDETTTTELTTEESTLPPIDWESELNIRLELAKAYVISALTSVLGLTVLGQIAKLIIDKKVKLLIKKVEEAENANMISKAQAEQLTASMQVAQNIANTKIDSITEDLEKQRIEFESLNGNVSSLLAEIKERDRLLGILLDQIMGDNDGDSDGQE